MTSTGMQRRTVGNFPKKPKKGHYKDRLSKHEVNVLPYWEADDMEKLTLSPGDHPGIKSA